MPPLQQKEGKLYGKELEEKLGTDFAKKVKATAKKSKQGLSGAAAINTICWKLLETLKATGLSVISGTGGKTAYHRNLAGLPKTHYYEPQLFQSDPKISTSQLLDMSDTVAEIYGSSLSINPDSTMAT